MKTVLACFLFFVLLVGSQAHGQSQDHQNDWEKSPALKSFALLMRDLMRDYETWAVDWKKNSRTPAEGDQIINRMAEASFVRMIALLNSAPNPRLAGQCVRFLDENVPPEFDGMWSFVFIEISNVSLDEDGRLRARNLVERSMGRKPK